MIVADFDVVSEGSSPLVGPSHICCSSTKKYLNAKGPTRVLRGLLGIPSSRKVWVLIPGHIAATRVEVSAPLNGKRCGRATAEYYPLSRAARASTTGMLGLVCMTPDVRSPLQGALSILRHESAAACAWGHRH